MLSAMTNVYIVNLRSCHKTKTSTTSRQNRFPFIIFLRDRSALRNLPVSTPINIAYAMDSSRFPNISIHPPERSVKGRAKSNESRGW